MVPYFLCLLFSIVLVCCQCEDNGASEILTTTACPNARASFLVRLDTIYLYNIEYVEGTELNLREIQNSIDMSVASGLSSCNKRKEPNYAVERTSSDMHDIVTGDVVYDIIESTLREVLTSENILRAQFVRSIGENLAFPTPNGDDSGQEGTSRSSVKVASISAIVSFCFTASILVGLYIRTESSEPPGPLRRHWAHFSAKHREFFQDLDDEKSRPVQMARTEDTEAPGTQDGAISWSVSDLTSDGESIISSLRLDRIDEEEGEESDHCMERIDEGDMQSPSSSNIKKLEFVPSWESQTISYVPYQVDICDEEKIASSTFMKADISWLEDKSDEYLNPNESLEVSEGTLLGCAFVGDSVERVLDADETSVVTTPVANGHSSFTAEILPEGDVCDYHSPGNIDTVLSSDSEEETEYMSPRQSLGTQVLSNVSGSPQKSCPTPTEGSKETDLFLISWARDALTKLKNGEVPTFGSDQPE